MYINKYVNIVYLFVAILFQDAVTISHYIRQKMG
jgi:hypothetical protein